MFFSVDTPIGYDNKEPKLWLGVSTCGVIITDRIMPRLFSNTLHLQQLCKQQQTAGSMPGGKPPRKP